VKILIVTPIYPGFINETRRTSPFAIHYFGTEWVKKGHDVEVIRIWPYRPFLFSFLSNSQMQKYAFSETFNKDNVIIHRLPIKKIPLINFQDKHIRESVKKIEGCVREFNPDIILCHSISPSYYIGCYLAEKFNKPLFLTIHKTDITYLSTKNNLKSYLKYKSKANFVYFRSYSLRKKYSNLLGEEQLGDVILSGIDEEEIINIGEINKKARRDTLNFVIACNLDKNKRVDTVIKAVNLLKTKYQIRLRVIGEGPERINLEKYVRKNQLQGIVEFLGEKSREEVLEYMKASDVFVMVSSPETLGLVYLEAMSKGCLVIGSRGEGIDGVIRHSENGFLCEVDNYKELSTLMEYCINLGESEKLELLLNSYETVNKLTTEKCAEFYLEAIKDKI
jgi:L-malate glycosyltransferase